MKIRSRFRYAVLALILAMAVLGAPPVLAAVGLEKSVWATLPARIR